ncbi:unnamed protein product, partial [Cuscuta europaea]
MVHLPIHLALEA